VPEEDDDDDDLSGLQIRQVKKGKGKKGKKMQISFKENTGTKSRNSKGGENLSEPDEEAESSQKANPRATMPARKSNASAKAPEYHGDPDYVLMEGIVSFLDQGELYPILCGYFNKIMMSLLNKQRQKLLVYLVKVRRLDIFDKLLRHA